MMEYPVVLDGRPVGGCIVEDQGLYWNLFCSCEQVSDRVERLYCGKQSVGVLFPEADRLVLRRRLSKSAVCSLPPECGVFSLRPAQESGLWRGKVLGWSMEGYLEDGTLRIPYDPNGPCPCEPLCCFFAIEDGFWKLNLNQICPGQE